MQTVLTTIEIPEAQSILRRSLPHAKRLLHLTFIHGPTRLLTCRLSVKGAALIVAMCSPSLLFCALLTLPGMIFQSPHQNAYYQFAHVLDQDPTRWIVLVLVSVCALLSLAVPATMPEPHETSLY